MEPLAGSTHPTNFFPFTRAALIGHSISENGSRCKHSLFFPTIPKEGQQHHPVLQKPQQTGSTE
jgi:hypothetical protein